jgi:hypothetical protein
VRIGTSSSQPETEEHMLSIYIVLCLHLFSPFSSPCSFFVLSTIETERMLSISLTPTPSSFLVYLPNLFLLPCSSLCFLNPITNVLLTYMDTSSLHCSLLLLRFMTLHSVDVNVSLLYHHCVWITYRPSKSINLYHATFFAYMDTLLPYMETFFLHCLLLLLGPSSLREPWRAILLVYSTKYHRF